MSKNNEYVGVNEEFIPEEEKSKQHVSESIIGDDTRNRIKGGIRKGTDYLASDEGKEKAKKVGKKGLKIAKGIGIGYLTVIGVITLLVIASVIFVFVLVGKNMKRQNEMIDDFEKTRDSVTQIIDDTTDEMQEMRQRFFNSTNE